MCSGHLDCVAVSVSTVYIYRYYLDLTERRILILPVFQYITPPTLPRDLASVCVAISWQSFVLPSASWRRVWPLAAAD